VSSSMIRTQKSVIEDDIEYVYIAPFCLAHYLSIQIYIFDTDGMSIGSGLIIVIFPHLQPHDYVWLIIYMYYILYTIKGKHHMGEWHKANVTAMLSLLSVHKRGTSYT
jgi:hypothetical protein